MIKLRDALGIGDDWAWRFGELSSGQQKRLQVAVALWSRPDVLVLDEPTNHLDAHTRKAVLLALRSFSGVGILISHDRDLLDALVERCISFEGGEVRKLGAITRIPLSSGNARPRQPQMLRRVRGERSVVWRPSASDGRRLPSRADGLRSRRGLDPRDHDAREKIGRAIVSGKDGRATHLATTLDARIKGERDRMQASYVERRYDGNVPSFGERSRRSFIARLPEGTVRYGGIPDAPGEPRRSCSWFGAIALGVGPNGSGKSTLVRRLLQWFLAMFPCSTCLRRLAWMVRRACAQLQGLAAGEKGQVLPLWHSWSRPDALLRGGRAEPGSYANSCWRRRFSPKPQLLVMDEPTNHLDLHSIEALERLLSEFPGAVVLVSHDARVMRSSCGRIWELLPASGDDFTSGAVVVER